MALRSAIEETEKHLLTLGFNSKRFVGATGFDRIQALADAIEVVYTSDESKRRFEIMARQVFIRFKALDTEPAALAYAERHDNNFPFKALQEEDVQLANYLSSYDTIDQVVDGTTCLSWQSFIEKLWADLIYLS